MQPSLKGRFALKKRRAAKTKQRLSRLPGLGQCCAPALDLAVIVAVAAVRVMQVAGDKVVRVIPVGNGFVATIGAVLMPGVMVAACMIGRTGVGVLARDAYCMFVMMISMLVVHVTVVQIVGVPFVLNCGMAAIGTMGMVTVVAVVVSFVIVSHGLFLLMVDANVSAVCAGVW